MAMLSDLLYLEQSDMLAMTDTVVQSYKEMGNYDRVRILRVVIVCS